MREQAGGRHLLEHKSSQEDALASPRTLVLPAPHAKKIKKLLGK